MSLTERVRKANMLLVLCRVLICACLAGFSCASDDYPWLTDLDSGPGVKASGLRLMDLSPGLHPLEQNTAHVKKLLIGVHGFGSKGYEWIYPLQTLDDENTLTFFHRWNTFRCTNNASAEMALLLRTLLATHTHVESVEIIGHSYGGLVAVGFIAHWEQEVPTQIHTVAAPLAGTGSGCANTLPRLLPSNIEVTQWRTIQALDNAFKDWPTDPQIAEIPGSLVARLPETYRGRRLGHNWSISWVADNI